MITQNIFDRSLRQAAAMVLIAVLLVSVFTGCKKEPPTSIYDLYNGKATSGGTPTVTSVSPANGLSGVTVITISGANFSTDASQNIVFFDATPATILQCSPTQLIVRAPVLTGDSVKVRIGVQGSEKFSESRFVKLEPAVIEFATIPNTAEEPVGITTDIAGNVYVSFLNSLGPSVTKILPDGTRSIYSPAFASGVKAYSALKMGPGGILYGAVNFPFLFKIATNGTTSTLRPTGLGKVYDFDFDAHGNLWGVGANASIYRINPTGQAKAFPFSADLKSARVFNGYLYVAGQTFPDSLQKIVRFPITATDSLGSPEVYFNFSSKYPGMRAYAITFTANGEMFVGTDAAAGSIVLVHADGTSEQFYPGLLSARSVLFAYGATTELYVTRSGDLAADKKIIRIWTERNTAPYYGRQ